MKMRWWTLGMAASLLPCVAAAHHSFAMFDQYKVVELSGTVQDFQWTNPHSWLDVVVLNKSGVPTVWGIEMNGPGALYRAGWRQASLKPGDKVSLQIRPLRDGRPGGSLVAATLPNGTTLASVPGGGQRRPGGAQ